MVGVVAERAAVLLLISAIQDISAISQKLPFGLSGSETITELVWLEAKSVVADAPQSPDRNDILDVSVLAARPFSAEF
ncbi:hypothetical protein DPM33_17815 [Mesorhizobium hawassense]|uniref:Uncharacterized protein n=1 Tax=Mesorhizobium hawassense TaxID=1209954 RepID=A0A330HL96_9HYPH|nr:hypothetical protein DPM33_17815 [Mesorhizobium hawassense]